MKILYIGQFTEGTTSKMRAQRLKLICNCSVFDILDTHIPFFKTKQPFRSLGFKYKIGPLVKNTNEFIKSKLKKLQYDIIWIDKGVYMNSSTMSLLRSKTDCLVHFTPDPAFAFHKSKLFNKSIAYYDFLITTKSYEMSDYHEHTSLNNVILTTQGFDKNLHKPKMENFKNKTGFLFIGHHEDEREEIIQALLDARVSITLAGIRWENFYQKNKTNPKLNYLGNGIYGENYVKEIQNAKIGWGAISKWVPELHTTRTFEIPACGTALLTEKNNETSKFFTDSDVIFYESKKTLIDKTIHYLKFDEDLQRITLNGLNSVNKNGFDYDSILKKILNEINLIMT